MKEDEEETQELICIDCTHFYPAVLNKSTEFGFCLNDEAFQPFLEKIVEKENLECCRELIEKKKFRGDRAACRDYSEGEIFEFDEESELGKKITRAMKEGNMSISLLEDALVESYVERIEEEKENS